MVETSSCVHNEISCKVAKLSLNIFIKSVPRPDLCICNIYIFIYKSILNVNGQWN